MFHSVFTIFVHMKRHLNIILLLLFFSTLLSAQEKQKILEKTKSVFLTPMCIYQGDTIPWVKLKTVYVYKPLIFKNKREEREYSRLVRNVKKVLPIANEINALIIETYEYLMTLPNEKERQKHIRAVEKGLKEQYTARMKKLTYSQGKLLIKLVDRQTNSTGYELVKAFMGPFKAGFYQAFAALFGASLKKEYKPYEEDMLIERVVILVENGLL